LSQLTDKERAAYLDRRYRKNTDMVSRQIGDEFILVPVRRNVADLESIYTLGGAGVRIWEMLEGQLTGRELRDRLVEEFEIEPEEAEADLIEFLQQLEEIDGIVEAEGQ
jgi:hypothetical protein